MKGWVSKIHKKNINDGGIEFNIKFFFCWMADLSKDKEAMQNTIKTLQAKTDYIYGLENKASKVLVL